MQAGFSVSIRQLADTKSLTALASEASAEGHRMVARLLKEWETGLNRFDKAGECLYAAAFNGHICGVCGLNIDPFAGDNSVGRVRRLYISAVFRRQGVASAMIQKLLQAATGHFRELQLRTHDPAAAAFYEAVGFSPVRGMEHCTHRRSLNV